MTKILVVAEVKGNEIKKPTLELLSQAKRLNLEADAILIGSGVRDQANTLAGYGAKTVYVADDPSLALYSTSSYTALAKEATEQSQATQIWLTSSELGKDLTPRLAARLGVGAISDITKLEVGDTINVYRPAMSSKVIQHCTFSQQGPHVLSVRSGAFDVLPSEDGSANVVDLSTPEADGRAVIKEIISEGGGGEIELGEANIIVSAGRGVKGPEGIDFVRPLAEVLGAAFGGSRAVCDAGWMPHSKQVGQTGKVVAPDVYFAIGISGAIQHLAGMSGSKLIIAVNKDPDAPIFKVADYGIVGDLFKVVPILIEEIKKIKS